MALDRRTLANMRMGRLLSEQVLRKARTHEAESHRLIGAIFLAIVLVSPGGLVGLWDRAVALVSGRRRGPTDRTPVGRPEPTV